MNHHLMLIYARVTCVGCSIDLVVNLRGSPGILFSLQCLLHWGYLAPMKILFLSLCVAGLVKDSSFCVAGLAKNEIVLIPTDFEMCRI